MVTVIVVIALLGWQGVCRVVRRQILRSMNQEYILAAHPVGSSNARIIVRNLLPISFGVITVLVTFRVAKAI